MMFLKLWLLIVTLLLIFNYNILTLILKDVYSLNLFNVFLIFLSILNLILLFKIDSIKSTAISVFLFSLFSIIGAVMFSFGFNIFFFDNIDNHNFIGLFFMYLLPVIYVYTKSKLIKLTKFTKTK